ncbi:20597_t:CDS:2 [Gigaspora margarita]|uniref:20597_t:CDS:1 n=1 Tax=Gigaspora margarita TaxID=4874 RepID=A0ABM8VVS1_GIGMA|nr:20597_t:CDS:2 [Gigaspora margarita]
MNLVSDTLVHELERTRKGGIYNRKESKISTNSIICEIFYSIKDDCKDVEEIWDHIRKQKVLKDVKNKSREKQSIAADVPYASDAFVSYKRKKINTLTESFHTSLLPQILALQSKNIQENKELPSLEARYQEIEITEDDRIYDILRKMDRLENL